jgi:hypothetical protein
VKNPPLRDYWRGKSEAIERVRALHPKPPAPENFVLSDAQLVIARGYGFTGWPHMKRKIESLTKSLAELFKAAVEAGDVDHARQLLQSHPDLVSMINEPIFSFKSPDADSRFDPHETSGRICCDAQFSDMVAYVTRPKGQRMRRREFFGYASHITAGARKTCYQSELHRTPTPQVSNIALRFKIGGAPN